MFKTALVAGLLAGLALVLPPATSGSANAKCVPGQGAHDGWCLDPVGDVAGTAGPDITRVDELEWGTLFFKVTFAKTGGPQRSPLAHTARYADEVSVILTVRGTKATKRYRLTLFATDLTHEVLQGLPTGTPVMLQRFGGAGTGRSVTLALDLRPFVGGVWEVRYRVEAVRLMRNGTVASIDDVPNRGTMIYRGNGRQ